MRTVLFLFATIVLGLAAAAETQGQAPPDPMERAIAELQAGDTAKAINWLNEAIRLRPDYADAYLLRGNLRTSSGDTAGALADLSKVIELKPDHGSAYYERAVLRLVSKDVPGALKDLDAAIDNHNKGDHVYSLRAQLRMEQNQFKDALADLNEAIRLNPNNPSEYNSRAHVFLSLGDRDSAFADLNHLLNWYESIIKKKTLTDSGGQGEESSPKTEADNKGKESAKENLFKVEVAVKTVNQSPADKEMAPIIAHAYSNRGLIHSQRNNSEAAIADFNRSIQISASNDWAFFYRAQELEGKGDLAAALSDIEKAIELDPTNGNFRVEHGAILLIQGKNQEAQVDFDMLLKSDPVLWQKRIDERVAALRKKAPNSSK